MWWRQEKESWFSNFHLVEKALLQIWHVKLINYFTQDIFLQDVTVFICILHFVWKLRNNQHLFPITSKSKKAQLFNITFPCKRVTKTIYHQTLSGSLLLRDLNSFSQYLFMSHKKYQGSVEIKQKSKPGAQPQCIIWSCYLRFSLRGALRNMHKVGHVGELWRAKSSNYRHRGWRPSASKFICCQYSQQIFLVSHQWQTCCSNPASVHLNFKSVFTT